MADRIVSWGGFDSKSTSGMGVTGSLSVSGSITTNDNLALSNSTSSLKISFGTTSGSGVGAGVELGRIEFLNGTKGSIVKPYIAGYQTDTFQENTSIRLVARSWNDEAITADFNNSTISLNRPTTISSSLRLNDSSATINLGAGTGNSGGFTFNSGAQGFKFVSYNMQLYSVSSPIITLYTAAGTNNVGINTTSDLSAKLAVKGSGATSSTTSLLIQNSSATENFRIYDNGNITVGLGTTTFTSLGGNGNTGPSSSIYFDNYPNAHQVHHQIITRAQGQGNSYNYLRFPTAYGGTYEFIGAGAGVTLSLSNSGSTAFMNYTHTGINTNDGNIPLTISPSSRTLTFGGGSNNVNHLPPYVIILKGNQPLNSATNEPGGDIYILGGLAKSGSAADSGSVYISGGTVNTQNTLYVTGSRVGIRVPTPNYTLDVSGSSEFVGSMLITGSVIISGSASTGEGSYNTVPSTLYVKNSIAVFTDLDNTASISLKGSSTNRGLKSIYFYHNNRSAWIESAPAGGGDLGGLRFGAGGNTVLDFGVYGYTAGFGVPVTAPSYGGSGVNSGTHYYNFNSSELAVRIASTRLGSSGRGNLKFQLATGGGDAADSDTFFYVPGTNKNISINSATTDLGATLGIRGSGTTSSTTALLVQNANASASLTIKDDLSITAAGSIILQQPGSSNYITINPTGSNFLRYYQAGAFEGNLMTFSGGIITFPNSVNFTNGLASSNIITTNNIGVDNSSTNRYIRFWKSGVAARVTITHTDTGTLQFRMFDSYDDTTGGIGMYITQQGNAGLTGSLTVGSLSTLSEDQRMSITNLGTYYGDMFGLTLPSSFDPGVMYQTTQGGTNWNGQIASGSNIITSYPAGGNYNPNYASYISVGDYVKDYNTGFRARVLTVSATTMSLDRNIAVSYTGSNFTYWPRAYGHTAGTLVYNTTTNKVNYWTTSSLNVLLDSSGSQAITGSLTISGSNAAVTMPSRPAFRVTGSGTMTNLTTTQNGDGTLNQNNWAVDYQQGSALTGSTGVFTAPLAGLYQISLVGRNSGYSSGISQIAVVKYSGASSAVQIMVEWASSSTMNHTGGSSITYMNVGDTLKLKVLAGQINFDGNDNWSVAYIG